MEYKYRSSAEATQHRMRSSGRQQYRWRDTRELQCVIRIPSEQGIRCTVEKDDDIAESLLYHDYASTRVSKFYVTFWNVWVGLSEEKIIMLGECGPESFKEWYNAITIALNLFDAEGQEVITYLLRRAPLDMFLNYLDILTCGQALPQSPHAWGASNVDIMLRSDPCDIENQVHYMCTYFARSRHEAQYQRYSSSSDDFEESNGAIDEDLSEGTHGKVDMGRNKQEKDHTAEIQHGTRSSCQDAGANTQDPRNKPPPGSHEDLGNFSKSMSGTRAQKILHKPSGLIPQTLVHRIQSLPGELFNMISKTLINQLRAPIPFDSSYDADTIKAEITRRATVGNVLGFKGRLVKDIIWTIPEGRDRCEHLSRPSLSTKPWVDAVLPMVSIFKISLNPKDICAGCLGEFQELMDNFWDLENFWTPHVMDLPSNLPDDLAFNVPERECHKWDVLEILAYYHWFHERIRPLLIENWVDILSMFPPPRSYPYDRMGVDVRQTYGPDNRYYGVDVAFEYFRREGKMDTPQLDVEAPTDELAEEIRRILMGQSQCTGSRSLNSTYRV